MTPDALEQAARCLASLDRAESPAERATLLASAEALIAPVRAKVAELDTVLLAEGRAGAWSPEQETST